MKRVDRLAGVVPVASGMRALSVVGVCWASGWLAGCATPTVSLLDTHTVTVQRTAHGVAHISAPDPESLAYGVAYAHAQDNVCQTAEQLVTVRAQRSRHFGGGAAQGLLGRRLLPNEQIDFFVAAHMDDVALAEQWAATSAEARALARGYVAGYNRYLADQAHTLPTACRGRPWLQPMTLAEYQRLHELMMVQASSAAFADAILRASPPTATTAQGPGDVVPLPGLKAPLKAAGKAAGKAAPRSAARTVAPVSPAETPAAASTPDIPLAQATQTLQALGLLESNWGSNAWAFGKDVTAQGTGVLLGNPHFPWSGVNRFWQMHLTIPGQWDVMGAAIGHGAVVQIGFNRDVAWSHTVSTGKRFTLHELSLVPGKPTRYLVDGQPQTMQSRTVTIDVRGADGTLQRKSTTVWSTRWGPVVVIPGAGLNWTSTRAYALQDANAGNARSTDTWLGFARARSVTEVQQAMGNLGLPWVNTLAVDRQGQALYADLSVVPDVEREQLKRCAPSAGAAALFKAAGLVVLDGSRSDCDWRRDAASPVPGRIAPARLPVAVRTDWLHNSNDSFWFSHPAQRFAEFSPLVGEPVVTRPRTRAAWQEIPALIAKGPVTPQGVQQQLFENRNVMAEVVLPDLLSACGQRLPAGMSAAAAADVQEGCAVLKAWNRTNTVDARGAHLFREFWRTARGINQVYRVPVDPAQPVSTPMGLKMDDPAVAAKVWDALAQAVSRIKVAGLALDAPLGQVQRPLFTEEAIGLPGGEEFEGVLNNVGQQFSAGPSPRGWRIDYGTSYLQTVTFDANGPVAQGLLTYGQSSDPSSPQAVEQLRLFSRGEWPVLPFGAEDVVKARVGEVLRLTRPGP